MEPQFYYKQDLSGGRISRDSLAATVGGRGLPLRSLAVIHQRCDIPAWLKSERMTVLAEVGVRAGDHLLSLLKAEPVKLVAVDLWANDGILGHNDTMLSREELDRCYTRVCGIAARYPSVEIRRGLSAVVASQFNVETFDFVYIDADHTYEGVRADLEAWWPTIKPGGVLGGHDYVLGKTSNGVIYGVVPALHEFIGQHDLRARFHCTWPDERPGNWFVRK